MEQLLKDLQLDEKLLTEGYVVVPFLSSDEVATLVNNYYKEHSPKLEGMYATAHVPDLDFRVKMNDFIKLVFARAIKEHFINYNALGGSYIAKGKGSNGVLHPHQDWNIVDEANYRSFNVWVPLVDLNEHNGAINILPKSHVWLKNYRSANIHSAYSNVNEQLWKSMKQLYMKAGEALIYDHRLLHASSENTTEEIRLTAVYGIIPAEAKMMYYHKADDTTVEVFESNPEFFLYSNIFEGPKGLKSVGKFSFDYPQIDVAGLEKLLQGKPLTEYSTPPAPSLFKRVRQMLHL